MISYYFKTAIRGILANKAHSAINIGGLAISMSVVVLIMCWLQTELGYDRHHRDAERLYLLSEYDEAEGKYGESNPYAAYRAVQDEVPEVELAAAACQGFGPVITAGAQRFYDHSALYIDSNWTRLLNYEVEEGTLAIFNQSVNQIAISRTRARQFFGDQSALGRPVRIDSTETTVGAVFADLPPHSSFQQDVLIPNHILLRSEYYADVDEWSSRSQWILVKLGAEASPVRAAEKTTSVFRKNNAYPDGSLNRQELVPVTDLHLHQGFSYSDLPKGNRDTIAVFTVLGILLLLTACVNFVNLSVARAAQRTKEVGIRKVTGASKRQLFTLAMSENVVAAAIAMVLTVVLVVALLSRFNAMFQTNLVFSLYDLRTAAMLVSVLLAVTVLTGIYPALLIGNISPLQLFKGQGVFRVGSAGLRNGLLVGQLILAIAMIISVLVVQHQYRYIQRQAAGYQMDQAFSFKAAMPDHVLYASQQQQIEAHRLKLQTIKSDLLSSSAIKRVARVNGASIIDNPVAKEMDFTWMGYPSAVGSKKAVTLEVDHDYLALARLRLHDGRWFDPANVSDKNNIVINEAAVRAFGLEDPIVGTQFNQSGFLQGTIIGVVEDFHHASLHHPIQPVVIELGQHGMGHKLLVEAQDGRAVEALEAATQVWKDHYPDKPFEYLFLDQEFDRLYQGDRQAFAVLLTFASLSLLISCLGMLGMVIYSARRRVKEIGIRKVLGATVSQIVTMLSLEFVKMALLAFFIAAPIAWWATNRWLEDFAYRVAIPWWSFAIAGLAGVAMVVLTVGWHTLRAAMANPVTTLRDE